VSAQSLALHHLVDRVNLVYDVHLLCGQPTAFLLKRFLQREPYLISLFTLSGVGLGLGTGGEGSALVDGCVPCMIVDVDILKM